MRRLAVELRPSALDDFGLVAAVERLADNLREQSDLQVDLEAQLGEERLPREVETALYRIIQEALTNIVKHAEATRVSILLTHRDGLGRGGRRGRRLWLRDPSATSDGRARSRRACASESGSSAGGFGSSRPPESGTTVRAEVPLR